MPFNNNYNRGLARDLDYLNRKYIAHCDSTGQGTQNYRVQISNYSGAGAGSKEFKGHYHSDSDNESPMDEEHPSGRGIGGAILGFQSGTILGGPRQNNQLKTRAQISSTSSLGVPLQTSNAVIAEQNQESTPDAPMPSEGNTEGGAILGMKPYRFATSTSVGRNAFLTTQRVPATGRMYRAGRFVSVRDLGDDDVRYSNKRARSPSYESDSGYSSSDKEVGIEVEIVGSGDNDAKPDDSKNKKEKQKDVSDIVDARNKVLQHYNDIKKGNVETEDKVEASGRPKIKMGKKPVSSMPHTSFKPKSKPKPKNKPVSSRVNTLNKAKSKNIKSSANKTSKYDNILKGISTVGMTAEQIANLVDKLKSQQGDEGEDHNDVEGGPYEEDDEEEQPEEEEAPEEDEAENDVEEAEQAIADKQAREKQAKQQSEKDKKSSEDSKKLDELSKAVKEGQENKGPSNGPKWLKDKEEGAKEVKDMKPVGKVLGFEIYSETPEEDWIKTYSDEFGDFEGLTIAEIINELRDLDIEDDDIQMYLKQSQGAIKALESKGVSSTLTSAKVTPHDIGNKNKNTTCMDAFNTVANANETAQREVRPVRQNDSYFGTTGGYFKTTLKAEPKKQQEKIVPKAQMPSSTMSGMGKPVKKAGRPRKLKGGDAGENIKETAEMLQKAVMDRKNEMDKSNQQAPPQPTEGKGKPKKEKKEKSKVKRVNKRAEVVKKVMKEKNLSMIEASKYVKANGLYP